MPAGSGHSQRYLQPGQCLQVRQIQESDFGQEGTLELGICGMHYLLTMSLLWLGTFPDVSQKLKVFDGLK